jgi:hypothetical protein
VKNLCSLSSLKSIFFLLFLQSQLCANNICVLDVFVSHHAIVVFVILICLHNLNLQLEPDSLALSLLMDNKGMNPLDVSITAPDYVTLAEDTVHVEANDHNEV